MIVYIAEKPELARAIADAIDGVAEKKDGYIKKNNNIITWCFGHLLQLKNPDEYDEKYKKWSLETLPFDIPSLELKPIKDKAKQVNTIKQLLKDATEVVNAGDPDEEGQLLVDELLEYLGNKKPVKRVLINDNTKEAVKKALNNLRDNKDFEGLKNSAYVRSVADWKYGLNLTRAYTLKANNGTVLSVGRVQTPILNLIYERENEVKNHIKEKYYNLYSDNNFKYNIPKDKLDEKLCKDKSYLESIEVEAKQNNDFIITNIDIKKQENQPPLPYNLLELQADAFKKFKYKPEDIKNITQSLREKHKAITYNRSDCQYLTDEHYSQRKELVISIKNNLSEYKNIELNTQLKHKAFNNNNVSAHHAIIPTINNVDISKLNDAELKVYKMIAERYLILYLEPEIVEKTTYTAINSNNFVFTANTNKVLSSGYKNFYNNKEKTEVSSEEESNLIYHYQKGDNANFKSFDIKESETKPKQIYTFATLLKDLTSVAKYIKDEKLRKELIDKDSDKKGESGGIGTSATRDSIIKTLFDRGFLEEKQGKIYTTDLGKSFLNSLPAIAKTPDMTALWSEKQREIKEKKLEVNIFIKEIDLFIDNEINKIKQSNINITGITNEKGKEKTTKNKNVYNKKVSVVNNKNNKRNSETYGQSKEINKTHKCPNCENGYLQERKGSYGAFWGCNQYPNCKSSFKDYKGKPQLVKGVK